MYTPSSKQDKDLYPSYGWPYLDPTNQERNNRKEALHTELNEIRSKLGLPLKEKEEVNIKIDNKEKYITYKSENSTILDNNKLFNNTSIDNHFDYEKENDGQNKKMSDLNVPLNSHKEEQNQLNNVNVMRKMMNDTQFYINEIKENSTSNNNKENIDIEISNHKNNKNEIKLDTKNVKLEQKIVENLRKRDGIINEKRK